MKTESKIPIIEQEIPEIKDEIKKPEPNNHPDHVDLELKADTPDALWETFLERRKNIHLFAHVDRKTGKKTQLKPRKITLDEFTEKTGQTTVGQGAGNAQYGNPHETGMETDWDKAVDGQTYIGKPSKESKDDEHE